MRDLAQPVPAEELSERLKLALQISKEVVAITASQKSSGLPEKLNLMARLVADHPGIEGALVVAFDEETSPLTCGSQNLALDEKDPDSQLAILLAMRASIPQGRLKPSWFAIERSFFQASGASEILAFPVQSQGVNWGLIVALPGQEEPAASQALFALQESGEILATAIQTAVQMDAWSRIEKLQEVARKEFEKKPDLKRIVKDLAALYEAGVATLFLEDQGELRLAASTDEKLGTEGPVIYRSGQGLTGYVFKTNRALRLKSTGDPEEVLEVTGLDRKSPVHPEHDGESWFTGQFLAVPLRYGQQAVGVLRMSRRGSVTRFTLNDEKSLQSFADLMAIELSHSRDFLLMRSVLLSASEAIAVSKREPDGKGGTWPRIIMVNPGTEKLVDLKKEEIVGRDAREALCSGRLREASAGPGGRTRRAEDEPTRIQRIRPRREQNQAGGRLVEGRGDLLSPPGESDGIPTHALHHRHRTRHFGPPPLPRSFGCDGHRLFPR